MLRAITALVFSATLLSVAVAAASEQRPTQPAGSSTDLALSSIGTTPHGGRLLEFGFRVVNQGRAAASDVRLVVSLSLPLSAVLQGRPPSSTSASTGPVVPCRLTTATSFECEVGDLRPGQEVSTLVSMQFGEEGALELRARILSAASDVNASNDEIVGRATVTEATSSVTTGPTGSARPVTPSLVSPQIGTRLVSAFLGRTSRGRRLVVTVHSDAPTAGVRIALVGSGGAILRRLSRVVPTGRPVTVPNLLIGERVRRVQISLP